MSSGRAVRTRRSSEDVRSLLLQAARELFVEQGYDGTTTKQICERAGVAEPLLFSNFGSKIEIFDAAVMAPITEFVQEYVDSFADDAELDPEERADRFVRGLFSLAQRNRGVLLAAMVQRMNRGQNGEPDVVDHIAERLQQVQGVSDLHEYPEVDPAAITAAATGMVLGVALLDDLLFPGGSRRPSRDRLVAEMKKLVIYGATKRG